VDLPWFRKLRGSTSFREYKQDNDYFIGVAHFSERDWPRSYYHVLILLEKVTYRPVRCSQPFSFCKRHNIEYCIGFIERDDKYHFWVSQYDRDPIQITVDNADIPFEVRV
jgi:hypothetical protein